MASGLALVWFALGLLTTAAGTIAFLGAGWTEPDPWKRRFYHYSTAAAGAMALAYLLAVLGIGRTPLGGSEGARAVFWARALAWAGVAPTFLFALGTFAGADSRSIRRAAVLAAGVPVAGLLSMALSGDLAVVGWIAAVGSLGGVLALLFGPIGAAASRRHRSVAATFGRVRAILAVVLAGSVAASAGSGAGFGVLPGVTTLPLFLALDAGGVLLVGFFLCRSRAVLHWARPDDAESGEDAGSAAT
jgi:bacteriorhodopsin